MKSFFRSAALVLAASCLFGGQALAQENIDIMASIEGEAYVVEGARVHKIQSTIVDQLYEVRISVPGSYHSQPDQEYPIIYVLDGQWNFTMATDIVGKIGYDGMIPEAIVAAITWGAEGDNPNQLRGRDFTPSEIPGVQLSGGASDFLQAIEEEIIPQVESLYRGNGERVLTGSSLGGLFTTYAMLEKPYLFAGYVALSAPYNIEQEYFDRRLAEIENTRTLNGTRAYFGVGSLDFNKEQVATFVSSLKSKQLKGLRSKLKISNGVGHAGVEPIGYTHGYQYVFKRRSLKLNKELLNQYAGNYESFPGLPLLTLQVKDCKLYLELPGAPLIHLRANSKTEFYANGVDYDLTFAKNEEGIMTFNINVQGSSFPFTQIES
ncbi:alpha/beta hydrolase [Marinagarivorans cellulosilyticus]|uniref:Esterase n=1 Tax=Marinagarivorans cellulosilyticus TaxID=2721545 RepID=A0AAN1WGW8_9GAMM|nr:alpha/beta hydrolase-fold protein [Marinagarivorans cellulosilyticus]BCD97378.1 hypothetical protein MARGE09_P1579 [Marinagarivorans cellulosilyticus]